MSTDIAAAPAHVWAAMSDVVRWHEWTASITSVKLFGGRLEVGARAFVRQPGLPPAFWKVTHLVAGRSFTWESVAPGLRVVG